jgi:acyl carrier protein
VAAQINVKDKVREILAAGLKKTSVAIIEDDKRIVEDLGADSLDRVELVMSLEEAFGIEIPDDVALKLLTVSDVINFIELKLSAAETKH